MNNPMLNINNSMMMNNMNMDMFSNKYGFYYKYE